MAEVDMQPLIVSFRETTRYDINIDAETTLFQAITGKGSYFTEVPCGTSGKLRETRAKFRELAVQLIEIGEDPGEVCLEDDDG